MKKIAYLLIVSLLFTLLPVESVEAATAKALATPTVVSGWNYKKGNFKYTFNHKNKNAKIYYRAWGLDAKWKCVKSGTSVTATMSERSQGIQIYAKVGTRKSKVRYCNLYTLDKRKVDELMKKEMNSLVDKSDNKTSRYLKLLKWFKEKYKYNRDEFYGKVPRKVWTGRETTFYTGKGICQDLADVFLSYCDILGIKAEFVACPGYDLDYKYLDNHAWCHVYLDKNPILVDPTCVVDGYIKSSILDMKSYKNSKYKFVELDYKLKDVYVSAEIGVKGEDVLELDIDEEFVYGIIFSDSKKISDIKIFNDKISYIWNEPADLDYGTEAYTVRYEMRYYPEDGYWYGFTYDLDGNLLYDGKAEVDAWYAAHPEVERK